MKGKYKNTYESENTEQFVILVYSFRHYLSIFLFAVSNICPAKWIMTLDFDRTQKKHDRSSIDAFSVKYGWKNYLIISAVQIEEKNWKQ
jgi:hypothetical protein